MHIVFRRSFVQRRTDTHPLTMWAIHTRYKTNIRGYVAGIDERGFRWCRYCRSIRMENARRGLYSDKRYRVRFIGSVLVPQQPTPPPNPPNFLFFCLPLPVAMLFPLLSAGRLYPPHSLAYFRLMRTLYESAVAEQKSFLGQMARMRSAPLHLVTSWAYQAFFEECSRFAE